MIAMGCFNLFKLSYFNLLYKQPILDKLSWINSKTLFCCCFINLLVLTVYSGSVHSHGSISSSTSYIDYIVSARFPDFFLNYIDLDAYRAPHDDDVNSVQINYCIIWITFPSVTNNHFNRVGWMCIQDRVEIF